MDSASTCSLNVDSSGFGYSYDQSVNGSVTRHDYLISDALEIASFGLLRSCLLRSLFRCLPPLLRQSHHRPSSIAGASNGPVRRDSIFLIRIGRLLLKP